MSAAAITPIGYMPMPEAFPYRSIFLHGRPRHEKYDDFWRRHPPMNPTHRAKIFSPFDALAGFGDCISSKEVPYCERRRLSEEEKDELNRKLNSLYQLLHDRFRNKKVTRGKEPQVTVLYFSPCTDENNFAFGTGGLYKTISGPCLRLDPVFGTITVGSTAIAIEDIADISSRDDPQTLCRSTSPEDHPSLCSHRQKQAPKPTIYATAPHSA